MFVVDFLRLNYFAILEARWSEIILPDMTIHLSDEQGRDKLRGSGTNSEGCGSIG
jgi:hypothetical protein